MPASGRCRSRFRSNHVPVSQVDLLQMRTQLEALIDEMLDGQILLDEAVAEFERLYIEKALSRHKKHLSNTAKVLGIHRNTLSKRVAAYHKNARSLIRSSKRASR